MAPVTNRVEGPNNTVAGQNTASPTFGILPLYINSLEERQSAVAIAAASLHGCLSSLQTNQTFAKTFFDSRSFQSSVYTEGLLPILVLCRIIMPADREDFLRDVCELMFIHNLKEPRSKTLTVSSSSLQKACIQAGS